MIRKWALAKIALVRSVVYGMFVSAKADFIFYSYPRPEGRGNYVVAIIKVVAISCIFQKTLGGFRFVT